MDRRADQVAVPVQPVAVAADSQGAGGALAQERLDYSRSKYNDAPWILLFVGALLALVAISSAGVEESTTRDDVRSFVQVLGPAIGITLAFSLVWTTIWTFVMRFIPHIVIHLMFVVSIAVPIVLLAFGSSGAGDVAFRVIVSAGISIYYFVAWNRIPLASATMTIASKCLHKFPASYLICIAGLVVDGALITFILAGIHWIVEAQWRIIVVMVLFVYTTSVIGNVVHTSTSGVAASFFFFSDPRHPTSSAFKRSAAVSLTTSSGT